MAHSKQELLKALNSKIESYIEEWDNFPMYEDEVTKTEDEEFELEDGVVAEVKIYISATRWYDRGDYYTPPESGGDISWETTYIEFYDEEGESMFGELNESLEGTYNY